MASQDGRIWKMIAFNFMDTASPALSSAGDVIFEPDDSPCNEELRLLCDCISSVAALSADRFVLMTITNSFRESPQEGLFNLRDIHVAGTSFRGKVPFRPASSFRPLAACLATPCYRWDPVGLNVKFAFLATIIEGCVMRDA